jgi:hypothetical protein
MAKGRPPLGPELVDNIAGSEHAKERMKILLETITGYRTVSSACEALGIGESAFYKMRSEWLEASLVTLEPKGAGRPARVESAESKRIEELEDEIIALKLQYNAAMVREKIAVAMPHLLVNKEGVKKNDLMSMLEKSRKERQAARRRKQEEQGNTQQ